MKMNKRRPIKEKHEQFLVDEFIRWWASRTGEQFHVVSRPDRPEAIVQSTSRTTWIEVTDVFFPLTLAGDLYSHATPGEQHKPMEPGPYSEMDEQMAAIFIARLKDKLSKTSYRKACDEHSPGILIVGMQSPWFNGETCEMMRATCRKADWSSNLGYFSHVFISFRSMNRQEFEQWDWGQHRVNPVLGGGQLMIRNGEGGGE